MHNPVMLSEVLKTLSPQKQETYIDATFGAGNYTRSILDKADCHVIALDRDPEAKRRAEPLEKKYKGRFSFIEGRFGDMDRLVPGHSYDGIVFDLGVSSPQIDDPARGFSFKAEGPLDMRMEKKGLSASDVVNTFAAKQIASILWEYGEERRSRAIAKAIVEKRPFQTTKELAEVVRDVVGFERKGFDPATRTFQALRLYVNEELGQLERGLEASEKLLKKGGRLVVVSFHSLEDRIVKTFLRERSGGVPHASRYRPEAPQQKPTFKVKSRKALRPTDQEIRKNPRARSAKLRWAIRLEGTS
ncbi:MAG: 16S rRNA (cytosine(1402)-N(4))-methyltransferase [Alphaproteobacteria bacterium GWC2_42_16]|nr:MAG: 16S rRNA (cytosine(1402)-N(4))-methyltransferase [Alphaproteobacteria bacterium GWC2_42_16]OFW74009.1 MAG: 16S rRNA (cytosine(1402)-N(4))-methyltransferase [Alphaproteobacteria bacterium GWA2_41_27]OFW83214.1 MAG: 16S rRNA (cytosine(1402)-N(4))-methyltransferase [Alphaproteobacteria bacterium RIFCSPHIGHO2_12_FULL_42_100]OFW86747.1 MAG: 16S rRNA (cytosine(1402)-N(4))-methyltransferase [Alphaproteobacteria bacterium RBG_16_42_14]OFW90789.1 MAG: 16S rRNA (cytosine(1402)-N(4))-methyltransfe